MKFCLFSCFRIQNEVKEEMKNEQTNENTVKKIVTISDPTMCNTCYDQIQIIRKCESEPAIHVMPEYIKI